MKLKLFKIKSIISIAIIFSMASFSFAVSKQSSQVIKSGHWIYDDLTYLASESKSTMYLETQPLTIGEINFFLKYIDYEALTPTGKKVFNKIQNFINDEDDFFKKDTGFRLFTNININPELYYKSNKNIDWTFNSYFVDDPLVFPVIIGFSDYFTIEADLNVGKGIGGYSKSDNFTNIPLSGSQLDFSFPDFAYFSGNYFFDNWGISSHMGKEGKKIGNTSLGSIIYNDTFNTDFYMQLNLISKYLKYSMDVVQVQPSKFLYLHQMTLRPFKNFNISVVEGSLLNSSFELRYLNPLMIMHSFGSWREYPGKDHNFYGESNFCAYLCFTLEYLPIKNMRIYALYAQNEILDLGGSRSDSALSVPDSLGGQLGIEYYFMLPNESLLKTGIEAVYTSPYLYVKHSPDWSLYRTRSDMQSSNDINTWIGSPYGPDCFALQTSVKYDSNEKWSVGFDYTFSIHGRNTIDELFSKCEYKYFLKPGYPEKTEYNKDNEYMFEKKLVYTYYPSVRYNNGEGDNAVQDARNMWMHGIPEYKNQFRINGHYNILDNLDLTGQFVYTFVFNNKNTLNDFAQGIELAFSIKYDLF